MSEWCLVWNWLGYVLPESTFAWQCSDHLTHNPRKFKCLFPFSLQIYSYRLLACMGEHYLVWPIVHLGGLVLLLQQLFQQFSLCPCQVSEVVAFLLSQLSMMGFLLKDLHLRQRLKTFSYTGEDESCLFNFFVIKRLVLMKSEVLSFEALIAGLTCLFLVIFISRYWVLY